MAERRLDGPHWAEPDVLIVGAGASGAAVAWSLADAGFRVVCLEQGDWVDPRTLPTMRSDYELHGLTDFNADPNVRQRPEDYPVNGVDSTYTPLMFNAVGGSTIHWSGHFPRFQPSDFRVRSLDGVADDWPLTYNDLEPFYDLNDRLIGVAGLAGDPSHPPRSARQTLPIAPGLLGETMARGFDRLGWHWWPSDNAMIAEPYGEDGRQPCNHCGPCDLSCPIGAMSSAHVTYWPKALRLGVELRTHCRVREIILDERDRAAGVRYYDRDGSLQEQRAALVVIACNGVGTPRLLLNSRSAAFPDGLANRSGLVGKRLMFHCFAAVGGRFESDLEAFKGPTGACILSHEFYETDQRRGFVRGYQLQIVRQGGPLSTARGGFVGPAMPWGREHHAAFARHHGQMIYIGVMGEDLPLESNSVTLDPALTDSDGIPAPRVRYALDDNSRKMLAHGVASASEVLHASGAVEVYVDNPRQRSGWHLMGTCRMGDDPATSVVDGWGRSHDVANLFIVDGSIFVTSAVGNPTTTIQALALRTADRIRREHAQLATAETKRHQTWPGAPVPLVATGPLRAETPTPTRQVLTAAERGTLAAALNLILPAQGELPAAGEGEALVALEAMLAESPALLDIFRKGLPLLDQASAPARFVALPAERQEGMLVSLAGAQPAFFDTLVDYAYRCYYTRPAVQRALGVASPLQPAGYQVRPFDPALLARQRERAPFWRRVDGAAHS